MGFAPMLRLCRIIACSLMVTSSSLECELVSGGIPVGKQKCTGNSCYKILEALGNTTLLMQGCDNQELCDRVGFPTTCCALPSPKTSPLTQKIICAKSDFNATVSEDDFKDCAKHCGSASLIV